jgi:hypothetical protein
MWEPQDLTTLWAFTEKRNAMVKFASVGNTEKTIFSLSDVWTYEI